LEAPEEQPQLADRSGEEGPWGEAPAAPQQSGPWGPQPGASQANGPWGQEPSPPNGGPGEPKR